MVSVYRVGQILIFEKSNGVKTEGTYKGSVSGQAIIDVFDPNGNTQHLVDFVDIEKAEQ